MSVFGGLEDNAPDGSIFVDPGNAWGSEQLEGDGTANDLAPVEEPDLGNQCHNNAYYDQSTKIQSVLPHHTQPDLHNRRRKKRLTVKITQIEVTKAEPIIWFDVQATLPRFRSSYKDIRRTHQELRRFSNHLASANPECFVPALPGPTNSFKQTEPDFAEKLKRDIQKWFDRVTRSPLLTRDDEFLYFVEATTGYVPVVKIKPPTTGLARKMIKQLQPPPDDVEELRTFRPKAKLLYQFSDELRQRLERVTRDRKQLGSDLQHFALSVRELSDSPQLENMWSHIARAAAITGDSEFKKSSNENTTIGDTMEVIGREGFIIKETLTNRHFLMRDLIKSQQATQECHQKATQLKGASKISPSRVDDAITQLEAAAHLERRMTTTVRRVSDNLVAEKQLALGRIEADILDAVGTYTLQLIDQDRRVLAAWENARPDVRAADPHHSGGLSNLGRHGEVTHRRGRHAQNRSGDDWSDRGTRAKDFAPRVPEPGEADILDAKSAASLLTSDIRFH